jgi:tRNA A-37 threonylcarbamoyl transferase component Bud32
MSAEPSCLGARELEQVVLGRATAEDVERLARHLEECGRCGETVEQLLDRGALVETLRSRAEVAGESEDDAVGQLVSRLRELRPAPAAPGETRAVADTPPPPGPAARRPEPTQDLYDFLAPPQGPGEIGRLGGYRVLKVLGSGGMGVVFEGEDVRLKRRVALKVMKPALAADRDARRRFLREAEATAAVHSDYVVTIHQVGEEGGVPFLAMEFLEGMPLDRWLQGGRKPSVAQVLRLGREMALGLAAAHARGLVHRDIKPGNLWLEASHGGRVKVLDFGLARAASDDVHLTQSGAVVGTQASWRRSRPAARKWILAATCSPSAACSTGCAPAATPSGGRRPWRCCPPSPSTTRRRSTRSIRPSRRRCPSW